MKKILIITNGGIGDQIHYSSLIKGLKQQSDCHIMVFCHPKLQFVFRYDKNVDFVTSSLDREAFDVGYNFGIRKDLIEVFTSVKIEKRIGFVKSKRGPVAPSNSKARELMMKAVRKQQSEKSLSEWFCEIADVPWSKPYFRFLSTTNFEKSDVVIQVGTNKEEKNWPIEHYNKLILELIKADKNIWVTAHKRHKEIVDQLCVDKPKSLQTYISDFDELYNVADLLSKTKVLISPDTAVIHVGLAVNTKVLVLSNGYDRGFALSSKFSNAFIIKEETMKTITSEMVLRNYEDLSRSKTQ